jgi:hypothetical protein
MTRTQRIRRESALERLQDRLKSGVTTVKGTRDETRPLTDKDIKNINREIENLTQKLKK